MLTLVSPKEATIARTPQPAPRLQPRDRRLIDAIVDGALAPPQPDGATHDAMQQVVPMIPWLVPGLAVLTCASILLIWATVL
jgi:hypothetical protein